MSCRMIVTTPKLALLSAAAYGDEAAQRQKEKVGSVTIARPENGLRP